MSDSKTFESKLFTSPISELKNNWRADAVSGFSVFLIALPLCLGIAMASGFPPISGIITAIIGGVLVSFVGGTNAAIKGPAAGLIVIAIGSVEELGKGDMVLGYKLTLAVIVVSGLIQIVFGALRSGILGDFFPSSAVHGMLASIGIIIFSKQIHSALGVKPDSKDPLSLIAEIPHSFANLNPEIAVIGGVSILTLFILPLFKNKYLKKIPGLMLVILVAIPLGFYFDLGHLHKYPFLNGQYQIGPQFLVTLPSSIVEGFTFPDFSQIFSPSSLKYILMFALVGSLESILSSKAVDIIDPLKRQSNLNKDLVGIGIGNTISGLIGGLPMISEIVRSSANINSGGRSKWSNFFHGIFLLVFVVFAPQLIHQIPLAALAAMLIYTGFRLASPKVFKEIYRVGWLQLLIFSTTIVVTLATDLIIGIFAGISVDMLHHILAGVPLKSLFKGNIFVLKDENSYTLQVKDSAVFSNFLTLKKLLEKIPKGNNINLDFKEARVVDHTVLEHLHFYAEEYERSGGDFSISGLEGHKPISSHPLSSRILVNTDAVLQEHSSRAKEIEALGKMIKFKYKAFETKSKSNFGKLSNSLKTVKYEGNILEGKVNDHHYRISDLSIVSGGDMKAKVSQLTALSISNVRMSIPIFQIEKETLMEKILDKAFMTDIDFNEYPEFSKRYFLRGVNKEEIKIFFNEPLIRYLEIVPSYNIASLGSEILIYTPNALTSPKEISSLISFAAGFMLKISQEEEIHKNNYRNIYN